MIERTAEEWAEEAVRIWRANEVATFTGTVAAIVREAMIAAYAKGRREAFEDAAKFAEGGSFLHDDAPAARMAKEFAGALRRRAAKEPGT